ncbi:hypothetical protein EHS25_000139 [Saitozyma podzolica]|uniref:Transcription factor CBF/NF-Y/archaeal histone domain-containing protein n=1 Tax=Saitozyma podzolica TaxID=1890683 RepID=A0A427YV84_9TREE|nr:hypothetical protein EHS25_000139 [Saitozyma podzolica]
MDNSNSYYPPTYFPGHMQPPSQPSGPSHLPGSHSNSHPHHSQPHVQGYASYPGSAEQSRQSTAAPSPSVSGSSQSPSASASAPHAYPPAQGSGSGTGSGSASHGPLVEPHQDLNDFLESFWTRQVDNVEREEPDFKNYPLPLARIKKVMKSDEDVKMISAEGEWAPIMFSRACEIFISELTCRAWLVAESHKRRTLQRSDVAAAIAFSDMFDFLIDIIPRDDGEVGEDSKPSGAEDGDGAPAVGDAEGGAEGEVEGEGEGDEQGENEDQGEAYSGRVEGEGYGAALGGEAINGAREDGYRDTGAAEFERFVHG